MLHSYGIFPLELSKCALKYGLFDVSETQDVIDGFMQVLPTREAEIVADFKNGLTTNPQPIQDILSDSRIFALPTQSNIDELILQAGKITLIRNPYHAMKSIVRGMGPF